MPGDPTAIPRDDELDGAIGIFRDGFNFIWNRCQRFDSDLFLTRVGGQRTVCMHGPDAARLFYDETKFQRSGAIPRRVITSLFGKRAVHTLDDAARHHRKMAFLSLMTQANFVRLMERTADEWRAAIRRWETMPRVVLFDEVAQILTRATCAWAGVPLAEDEVGSRSRDFVRMVDAFGGVGPRLWRGKLARRRTQQWIGDLIDRTRRDELTVDPTTALGVMANHRDLDGELLDGTTAAVELINVIRPTVAVSWYITFAAHALYAHPEARERLAAEPTAGVETGEYADWFMNEVRRFYPFAPFLGALVRTGFDWKGHHFEPGTLVLLDIYGANHDLRLWGDPQAFRPERFRDRAEDGFTFIPHGGGDPVSGHRCPGEWIAMHHVALALHFLARCVEYQVAPDQDLRFDLRRMPTRPHDGFIIRDVRATAAIDSPAPRLPSRSATAGALTLPGASAAPSSLADAVARD